MLCLTPWVQNCFVFFRSYPPLVATLWTNGWMGVHEIFRVGQISHTEQCGTFLNVVESFSYFAESVFVNNISRKTSDRVFMKEISRIFQTRHREQLVRVFHAWLKLNYFTLPKLSPVACLLAKSQKKWIFIKFSEKVEYDTRKISNIFSNVAFNLLDAEFFFYFLDPCLLTTLPRNGLTDNDLNQMYWVWWYGSLYHWVATYNSWPEAAGRVS